MSEDVQFFVQCDHVVNDQYYGTSIATTPTRIVGGGTTQYNVDGTWTSQLPISSPNDVYIPVISIPSGTAQYYYDDNWSNFLPNATVTNNVNYVLILAKIDNQGAYDYYYYNETSGNFTWNSTLPSSGAITYLPVIPKSTIITQYFYNNIWTNTYPDISTTIIYVSSMEDSNGIIYEYNSTSSMVEPQSFVFIQTRTSSFGSQQYYYNDQWNNLAPGSTDGTLFVFVQDFVQTTGTELQEYFYNGGWSIQQPTGIEVIQTRTLLNQDLMYLYNDELQTTLPGNIFAPMFIYTQEVNGVTQYNYNGGWTSDIPLTTNPVFNIENTNYINTLTNSIQSAYYYNDNWNLQTPLILNPNVEIDTLVNKDGSLNFVYNNTTSGLPPTEIIIVQQRILQQPQNQYYYDGQWNSSPMASQQSIALYYIPTRVMPGDTTQYYYNDQWNDAPQYVYDASMCPKCYGKGYYFDISFDISGDAILTTGSVELQQEILKIMIDQQGSNVFYPQWGNTINEKLIGHKNTTYVQGKLQFLISQTLNYLKQVQVVNQAQWKNMTPSEMIQSINSIVIQPVSPTGYLINVSITTEANVVINQTFVL